MSNPAAQIPFDDPRWKTLNDPSKRPKISKDGSGLIVYTEKETDWWHTPKVDSRSGVVYGFDKSIGKDGFEVGVDLDIDYKVQVREHSTGERKAKLIML